MHTQNVQKRMQYQETINLPRLYWQSDLVAFYTDDNACTAVNQAIISFSDAFLNYVKATLLRKTALGFGKTRYLHAGTRCHVHHANEKLICTEMIFYAQLRQQSIYQKSLFLYFTQNGSLPISSRALVGRPNLCLKIEGNEGIDILSQKRYPLRAPYRT